ncbi:MAG: hypothetical protein HY424_00940 [Candidatus Levybacteria bacterium]|nr:hypothetical protein [Candidatus Levybacteria bacterium]
MVNDLRFKVPYFFICLLGYLLITQAANASSLSLSIDPSIVEIKATPPALTTSTLTIKNLSEGQVKLLIQIKPFKAKVENARPPASSLAGEVGRGEPEYLTSTDSFISNNVKILDNGTLVESIALGPNQQKNLTLNINIPANINTSDYYFSIIFISQNISKLTSNTSLNQLGIASNVLLSVGPKEIPDIAIKEFSSDSFFKKGPVPFAVRVKNKGVHFIKPKGEIMIKNMFGQTIGKIDLASVNILSNSARTIPAVWEESFLLGFYTATLNVTFSNGPTFSKSIHFSAFPIQGIAIFVLFVLAGIVIKNKLKAYVDR